MKTPVWLVAVTVALSALLTSCGAADTDQVESGAAEPSASFPAEKTGLRNVPVNAFDDPASPDRITYSAGLLSDPLPASTPDVAVTASQALKIAAADPFGEDLQPGTPSVTLRLVTVGETSGMAPTPAWVLVWKGAAPRINGKPGMTSDQAAAEVASVRCLFVYVVDATSGLPLDAREVCEPKPA